MNVKIAFILIEIVFFNVALFAEDIEMKIDADSVYPLLPVFIKVTTPTGKKEEAPIATDQFGKRLENVYVFKLRRFAYRNKLLSEKWYILYREKPISEKEIFIKLPTSSEKLKLTILPLPDNLKEDFKILKDNKLQALIGKLLEHSPIYEKYDMVQIKKMATRKKSPYGYMATFALGGLLFESLVKKYNTNGPPGAYKSCYNTLELIVNNKKTSLLQIEALRRLFAAKACSSDYDESKKLAELLAKNTISHAYAAIGKKVVKEFPLLIKQRSKIDQKFGLNKK